MLIAITGGIGSGKSVVTKVLATMSYPVYDTDSQARRMMTTDETLKQELVREFGPSVYDADGSLNRASLAAVVFNNQEALERLNHIVHPAVIRDLERWYSRCSSQHAFVETAILYQSGLDAVVDAVWRVDAPVQVRIDRVMLRSNLTATQVTERIRAQVAEECHAAPDAVIVNDDVMPILPQIMGHLEVLK